MSDLEKETQELFEEFIEDCHTSCASYIKAQESFRYNIIGLALMLNEWINPYVREGKIQITIGAAELTDRNGESYWAPNIRLQIGGRSIRIIPIQCPFIIYKGRVDVCGANSDFTLVLKDDEQWYIKKVGKGEDKLTKDIFLKHLILIAE